MAARLTCRRCGDVIGVYEALIVSSRGRARASSRAAEPELSPAQGDLYHHACYLETEAEQVDRPGQAATDDEAPAGP